MGAPLKLRLRSLLPTTSRPSPSHSAHSLGIGLITLALATQLIRLGSSTTAVLKRSLSTAPPRSIFPRSPALSSGQRVLRAISSSRYLKLEQRPCDMARVVRGYRQQGGGSPGHQRGFAVRLISS